MGWETLYVHIARIALKLQIPDQEAARRAVPGDPFTFTVDASKTGWGEVAIDVVFENRSVGSYSAAVSRYHLSFES